MWDRFLLSLAFPCKQSCRYIFNFFKLLNKKLLNYFLCKLNTLFYCAGLGGEGLIRGVRWSKNTKSCVTYNFMYDPLAVEYLVFFDNGDARGMWQLIN